MNKVKIVIPAKCIGVQRMERHIRTEENGISTHEGMGWFARFEGSHEWLHIGWAKPDLKEGDTVKITIEKQAA